MISISLDSAGKKFAREWIFRGLSMECRTGIPVAITGPNGSGKSTLIKSISGSIPLNEGKITYERGGKSIPDDEWYKLTGISAPYLELIEEFTLSESLDFHVRFRPLREGISKEEFLDRVGLEQHRQKYVRDFSSGMKQKLKLAFAFFTQNDILLLDEPTANIDRAGYEWYRIEVQRLVPKCVVIISSNEPKEYDFCTHEVSIMDFKS